MKTPMPPIQETPEGLSALLTTDREAHKHQHLQALYLLQTQQARSSRTLCTICRCRK
jgi:hypothetical protein